MFVACGIWCLADVSSVSPSSEQSIVLMCWLFFSLLYDDQTRERLLAATGRLN